MTDDARIARLTELARKVWPHLEELHVIEGVNGVQIAARSAFTCSTVDGSPGEHYITTIMHIPAPRVQGGVARSLDALEAALRVLATGRASLDREMLYRDEMRTMQARAEAAEARVRELEAELLRGKLDEGERSPVAEGYSLERVLERVRGKKSD